MGDNFNSIWDLVLKSIIPLLTIIIIPIIIKYVENKYWSNYAKKRDVWRKFITSNQTIRKCFNHYLKIERESEVTYILVLGSTMLSLIYLLSELFLSISIISYVSSDIVYYNNTLFQLRDVLVFWSTFILISLFSTPLIFVHNSIKQLSNSMNSKNYKNNYLEIKKLNIICLLLSFVQVPVIISFINLEYEMSYVYVFMLFIPSIIILNLLKFKKVATHKLKNEINEVYSRKFPLVEISTTGAEHYIGQIKNVFDHDSILLTKDNDETIILWDAVATLRELRDSNQPTLFEYFNE